MEHRKAENRKDDSGDDETGSRPLVPRAAFIDVHVGGGAIHRSIDSPHIARAFCHPTQFLGEGELARFSRKNFRLESVGKVWAEEGHVDCCEQEYSIAAPKNIVFPGALERILRIAVKEEREETGEKKYPRRSMPGRIVNEEEGDLDENVECERKPLH